MFPESTLKMRLATMLSGRQIYRRFPNEYFAEAQEIVKEVEIGHCSSELCHLLGKFYNNLVCECNFNSILRIYYF